MLSVFIGTPRGLVLCSSQDDCEKASGVLCPYYSKTHRNDRDSSIWSNVNDMYGWVFSIVNCNRQWMTIDEACLSHALGTSVQ